MMNDLISRQQAIDALDKRFDSIPMEQTAEVLMLRKDLRNLPSAQPVATDTNVGSNSEIPNSSDCISRQAAIDLCDWYDNPSMREDLEKLPPAQPEYRLDEWCHDCKEYDQENHCCPRFNRVIREALKDAQPEPKEGHWIPHENPDGGEQYECSCCGVLWEFNDGSPEDNEAYFCPKCGADMRGEQHEAD